MRICWVLLHLRNCAVVLCRVRAVLAELKVVDSLSELDIGGQSRDVARLLQVGVVFLLRLAFFSGRGCIIVFLFFVVLIVQLYTQESVSAVCDSANRASTHWIEYDPDDKTATRTRRNVLALCELSTTDLEAITAGTRVVEDSGHRVPSHVLDLDFIVVSTHSAKKLDLGGRLDGLSPDSVYGQSGCFGFGEKFGPEASRRTRSGVECGPT